MAARKPIAWLIELVAAAGATFIVIRAFQGYHPKSPTCLDTALQRGVESMPSYCKFPIWYLVIAVVVLMVGLRIANTLRKAA